MLMPKRTKFRRPHRVSYEGLAKGRNEILNGDYALIAQEGAWVTNRQIEAARIAMIAITISNSIKVKAMLSAKWRGCVVAYA